MTSKLFLFPIKDILCIFAQKLYAKVANFLTYPKVVFTINFQEGFCGLAASAVGCITHVVSRVCGHGGGNQQLSIVQNLDPPLTHNINRAIACH